MSAVLPKAYVDVQLYDGGVECIRWRAVVADGAPYDPHTEVLLSQVEDPDFQVGDSLGVHLPATDSRWLAALLRWFTET